MGPLRAVKDPAEIEVLRRAGAAVDRIAAALQAGEIELIGRTEAEVSAELGRRILAEGHHRVNFAIVAAGAERGQPPPRARPQVIERGRRRALRLRRHHARRRRHRLLQRHHPLRALGDAGEPRSPTPTRVLQRAQQAAVDAAASGTHVRGGRRRGPRRSSPRPATGEHFVHRTGHGIGVEEHEDPYIVDGNLTPLTAGHAFSIEPGIYVPAPSACASRTSWSPPTTAPIRSTEPTTTSSSSV